MRRGDCRSVAARVIALPAAELLLLPGRRRGVTVVVVGFVAAAALRRREALAQELAAELVTDGVGRRRRCCRAIPGGSRTDPEPLPTSVVQVVVFGGEILLLLPAAPSVVLGAVDPRDCFSRRLAYAATAVVHGEQLTLLLLLLLMVPVTSNVLLVAAEVVVLLLLFLSRHGPLVGRPVMILAFLGVVVVSGQVHEPRRGGRRRRRHRHRAAVEGVLLVAVHVPHSSPVVVNPGVRHSCARGGGRKGRRANAAGRGEHRSVDHHAPPVDVDHVLQVVVVVTAANPHVRPRRSKA